MSALKTLTRMERRHRAAELITLVLEEAVTANYALAQWPAPTQTGKPGEDSGPDESLDVAYQALWHFASDDPAQYPNEPFYLDVQIEVLRTIAAFLFKGQALPNDLLAAYRGQALKQGGGSAPRFYEPSKPWWQDLTTSLSNTVRQGVQEYREAVALLADCVTSKKQSSIALQEMARTASPEPMTALFGHTPPPPLLVVEQQQLPKPQPPVKPVKSSQGKAKSTTSPVAAEPIMSAASSLPPLSLRGMAFPSSFPPSAVNAQPPSSVPRRNRSGSVLPQGNTTIPTQAEAPKVPGSVVSSPQPVNAPLSSSTVAVADPLPAALPVLLSQWLSTPKPLSSATVPAGVFQQPIPARTLAAGQPSVVARQTNTGQPAVTRAAAVSLQFSTLNERNAFVLTNRFPTQPAIAGTSSATT
jgi:hypothetical protein